MVGDLSREFEIQMWMGCNDETLLKMMLELCCDDLLSWGICLTLYPSDA